MAMVPAPILQSMPLGVHRRRCFTDLDRIRTDTDLKGIAMASDGVLHLRTTNGATREDVISLKVYRQSTSDRQHTLRIQVPAQCVASQHVWRHDANDQPVYYEAA